MSTSPQTYHKFSIDLGRDITLRDNEIDESTYEDTFRFRYHLPPVDFDAKTILDLGCNIGLTLAYYEAIWPQAKTIGIDIDRENCFLASKNTIGSIVQNVGVSVFPGYKWYDKIRPSDSYSISNLTKAMENARSVYCVTIDHILDLFDIRKLDFCKIDIEGEEIKIIENQNSEWHHRIEKILIEVHNEYPLEKIEAELNKKGYNVYYNWRHWSSLWATKSL